MIIVSDTETASKALELVHGYDFKGKPIIIVYGKKSSKTWCIKHQLLQMTKYVADNSHEISSLIWFHKTAPKFKMPSAAIFGNVSLNVNVQDI